MSGFLLLRKDRPNWPRPIAGQPAVGADGGRCSLRSTLLLLIWGGWNSGLAWGNTSKTVVFQGIGILMIAAVLYIIRVVVQEKQPLALRLWAPTMPDDVPPVGRGRRLMLGPSGRADLVPAPAPLPAAPCSRRRR